MDGDGYLRITVEEDGIGFGPESVDQKTHFELALMREDIEIVSGVIYVDSRIGGRNPHDCKVAIHPEE